MNIRVKCCCGCEAEFRDDRYEEPRPDNYSSHSPPYRFRVEQLAAEWEAKHETCRDRAAMAPAETN